MIVKVGAKLLLDALDELRFMHDLASLVNGGLLCSEPSSIDDYMRTAMKSHTSQALPGRPLASG